MQRENITSRSIDEIKRAARRLARTEPGRTYMQHLDQVAHDLFGVRHFHEARKLAQRAIPVPVIPAISPLTLYLQACQESYFEL